VIVLRSLGKNFGLHGVRFGYLVSNPTLAGKVRSALPKWNLNSFAETVVFMLKEHRQEYAESLQQARRDRQEMTWRLSQLPGMTVYPSQGNFLYVRLPEGVDGSLLRDRLLAEHGVLVRECSNKVGSSSRFLRLVVRPQEDVLRLMQAMEQVLYGRRIQAPEPPPQPMAPMLSQVPSGQPLPPEQGQVQAAMPMLALAQEPVSARGLVPARAQRAVPVPAEQPQPMAPGYSSGTAAVDRLIAGA
jgi:hypothetical protein